MCKSMTIYLEFLRLSVNIYTILLYDGVIVLSNEDTRLYFAGELELPYHLIDSNEGDECCE